MNDVTAGLDAVKARIAAAAVKGGRDPAAVTLVAVTKTFGGDVIRPAIGAGQKDFGENRVQEAAAKWPGLKNGGPKLNLHLIGPLQTNKVRDAVALFDAIHSLDREKLAEALAKEMARQERRLTLFVQVNTGEEPQKAGVLPGDAAAFVERCRSKYGLSLAGLMCIPPQDEDPAPHFDMLARLGEGLGFRALSMGMSGDFETAIGHGATHVRVGSAIFGVRD
jgi:pyridoxal phosphate enzyme (YggS family)